MVSLSKSLLTNSAMRTSGLVALCVLGCTVGVAGCGGGDSSGLGTDDDTGVTDETGVDSGARDTSPGDTAKDSAVDSGTDSGADTGKDTGGVDSGVDSGKDSTVDSGIDSGADTGGGGDTADSGADTLVVDTGTADTSAVDTSAVDTGVPDTTVTDSPTDSLDAADTIDTAPLCTVGTLCPDGTVCTAGTGGAGPACTPCATDGDCSVATGTLCFAGKCEVATCHPKTSTTGATGCTTGTCCATTSPATAGTCFSATGSGTACCDSTDCAGLTGTTTCDAASHTCVCPAPAAGAYFVGSKGSDTTGNGSSSCPFQTVTKALTTAGATPTVATSVTLLDDSGTTPTTYGDGCSAGGTLCDATPIVVPATFTGGVTIQGAAAAAGVEVHGAPTATDLTVFYVPAMSVSFKHLTVVPAVNTSATIPQSGIDYNGAATTLGAEGSVTDVVIRGTTGAGIAASTGPGVVVRGGVSPTIGPAFVATGGTHGVFVSNLLATGATGSAPTITSAAGAQTTISGTLEACIRVETRTGSTGGTPTATVSSSDAATPVALSDCGGLGGIVVDTATARTVTIGDVAVTMTAGGTGTSGIRLLTAGAATVANTTITGLLSGTGIVAEGSSSLTITANVSSNGNARGAHITGSAHADISGLTAMDNVGTESDGLACDAAPGVTGAAVIKLRNSTFLHNGRNGILIGVQGTNSASCTADLGTPSDLGNNIFNETTHLNGGVGVYYSSINTLPGGLNATVTSSFFTCTPAATTGTAPTCPTGTPSTGSAGPKVGLCNAPNLDWCSYPTSGSTGGAFAPPGTQFCCNN